MNLPAMVGLATAVTGDCYSQQQIYEMLRPYLSTNPHTEKIFLNIGVGYRNLLAAGEYYQQERSTQERNERYMQEAVPVAELAIRRCLQNAHLSPQAVDDLVIVSCTGIDTPGLDLHLAGRLGLPAHLRRSSVLGMGCYGAFPGLLRAREAALARPGSHALVVSVELCSLHFQPGDRSIENVVSSALFSDGAAAALIGPASDTLKGPYLVDSATYCDYQDFDHMAFHLTDHGFRMSFSAYVPRLLAAKVEDFVDELLLRNGLSSQDVKHWGVHPGSSKILDYVQQRVGLSDDQLAPSRRVLFEYGNMSSATILFVLEEIQHANHPHPGEWGVLMSFGPGLTMEGALVQW